MRWTVPLLLLLAVRCQGQPAPVPRRVALPGPTPDPGGDGPSDATGSPCEGLPPANATAWSLANRSLERLPGCLPRGLRRLDGGHNRLRALSARDLGALPELQALALRHNRIAALRWGPGGPAALRSLDLSYNRLRELPPCAAPALRGLRALALAGNPLAALPPRAFACLPALQRLDLSATALRRVAPGAFAGAALQVLDLSGTPLERVESGWTRDLPRLTSLYLRKMPRLRTLGGDIFKMTPNLQQLDCEDSPALTSVHTHIFQDTPRLQALLFQNCNLSSFPPWTTNSSQVLTVTLSGNPLSCSCELFWLLDTRRAVLSRAADTSCAPAAGSGRPFPGPLSLAQLQGMCTSDPSAALPASNAPSSGRSAHVPSTRAPSERQGTATPAQPAGGRRGVLKAPSPRRAAGTGDREPANRTDLEARVSTAPTPPVSEQLGPFPASGSPLGASQPGPGTRATSPEARRRPPEDEIPTILLDDYSEEEEEAEPGDPAQAPQPRVPCDYHPCRHLQPPCAELQRRSRCLCPGLSQADTVPEPPRLQGVAETTDTSALVLWCAPSSVVEAYHIRYAAEGAAGNQSVVAGIYATARQYPLYGLSPGTAYRVCVLAANAAGLSATPAAGWQGPCATFSTKPSWPAAFAGLSAACGLLLLATLALSACLCRRRARAAGGQRADTHLIGFKNLPRPGWVAEW
ncbi:leucine-rich repeat neuronal protein 4 [Ctenodactylus gundi]